MNDDRLPAGVTVTDIVGVLRPFADYADFCARKNIQAPSKNVAALALLERLLGEGALRANVVPPPPPPPHERDADGSSGPRGPATKRTGNLPPA